MTTAYEELVSVLYDEKDRKALEWAIGSALQLGPLKNVVIYGEPATGKSTILEIVRKIFEGTSLVDTADGHTKFVEVQDKYLFLVGLQPLDFDELEEREDVILVSTSGRVHTPARYQQLVHEIYDNPDEITFIAQACVKRFRDMGPTAYDHIIPTHIPEENNQ
jgi:energy-coupling factor transporter ATP-binding protein EcfA2